MRSIQNADWNTVATELRRMLDDGIRSQVVRSKALQVSEEGDEVASIFEWIKDRYRYTPDPYGRELFTSPAKLLEQYESSGVIAEDCDSASLLIAAMLGSIGKETKLVFVGNDEIEHIIAVVNTPHGRIDLDLTTSNPLGWVQPYQIRKDV